MSSHKSFEVSFLGTRGSAPCLLPTHQWLGGETSCVQVRIGAQRVLLDAGTGLRKAQPTDTNDYIVLSHLHLDHVLGLADFAARKAHGKLFIISHLAATAHELEALVGKVYGPPGYPVSIRQIFPQVVYEPIDQFNQDILGPIELTPITLNHPGGSFGTRVTDLQSGKSLAYLSDHEHGSTRDHEIARHCKDINLLIWDASYDDRYFAPYIGWGHSTWQQGLAMGQRCGAKAVALTHHDITRSDDTARQLMREISGTIGFFTRDDMTIVL
jgi:phosphoribosyl 1,2-cyclic phosphodiesterase